MMEDPFNVPSSILAILQLTGRVVQYLNSVANAPKERENVFKELSSITGLLFLIKDQAEQGFKDGEPSNYARSLNAPGGPLEQLKAMLETLSSRFSPVGALRRLERKLSWPFEKGEISGILQSMERLKAFFMIALQMDHFGLSKEVKSSIDDLGDTVKGLRVHQNEEESRRILEWLSVSDMDQKQQDVFSLYQEGTCSWFLQSDEFLGWLEKDGADSVLWCPGDPGAGKTVVTSMVIDHLQENYQDEGAGIAFAYCKYNDPEANTSLSIIASLARQLAIRDESMHPEVDRLFRKLTKGKRSTKSSIKELQGLLLTLASSFDRTYVLVDGIDECEKKDRAALLSALNSLGKLKNGQVRVFATSRPHAQDIIQAFKSSTHLNIRTTELDIEAFVRRQLENDEELLDLINASDDSTLAETIISSTASQASGMFLMAVLQMERIRVSDSVKEIQDALTTMPTELFDMYAESLERMAKQPETRYRRGLKILAWISRATRPLFVDELLHALVVEDANIETPPRQLDKHNLVQPKVLVDVCAGLVAMDQNSSIVRLVHATAQEYLDQLEGDQIDSADENISKACLNYLSFAEFAHGPTSTDAELEDRLKEYPFIRYSACFWGHHLQKAGNSRLQEAALTLLRHEQRNMAINQVSHLARIRFPGYSQLYPKQVTPLHIAAHLGLRGLVQSLLADGNVDLNTVDSFGWTALHRAAENGHVDVLRLLLEASCDTNISARYGGTALHRAAKNGHVEIAQLLLDSDAQASAEDNYGGTPLHRAAKSGHVAIAKLLLQHGIDIEQTYNFEVTLRLMMEGGMITAHVVSDTFQVLAHSAAKDEAVMRIEAELTARERLKGGTALHEAAGAGSEAFVQVLLDEGKAELDAADNFGGTALHRASGNGHKSVVSLLLERGASINAVCHYGLLARQMIAMKTVHVNGDTYRWDLDEFAFSTMFGGTPLCEAATNGHENTVRLLLEKGADANGTVSYDGSALQGAARKGHVKVVQILLDYGANIDSCPSASLTQPNSTALHEACESGQQATVSLLLQAGANVNRERDSMDISTTPLCLATGAGNEELVRLLLDWGAEVGWRSERKSKTALLIAAENGNAALVRILLSHGADQVPGATGGEDTEVSSPLLRAARKGHSEVVRLLLQDTGSAGDLKDIEYDVKKALEAAIWSGSLETVKEVWAIGSDPKAWPVLHWAIESMKSALDKISERGDENPDDSKPPTTMQTIHDKYEAIMQFILLSGADVSLTSSWSRETALHAAASGGYERIAALLLARGADVNAFDRNERTPLYEAARYDHESVVRLLLDAGALVDAGISPLYGAVMGGSEAAAQILLDHGAEITESSGIRQDALVIGAGNGLESVVRILLEEGESIETEYKGETALIRAARGGHETMIQLLADKGAQVEAEESGSGRTAVMAAVIGGHEAAAEMLLAKGANPHHIDKKTGRDLLSWAAEKGCSRIVRLLLEKGMKPDANSVDHGLTPLCFAVRQGHVAVVQLLASAGANVNKAGNLKDDASPLLLAVEGRHVAVLKELLSQTVKLGVIEDGSQLSLLKAAARNGDYEAVEALLEAFVDIQQSSLFAALVEAVTKGHPRISELLLDSGAVKPASSLTADHGTDTYIASTNTDNKQVKAWGQSSIKVALNIALQEGRLGIARRLLAGLEKLDSREDRDIKLLKRAAERGYEDVVRSLLDLGLDPDAQYSDSGRTALSYAAEQGHVKIVKLLLSLSGKKEDHTYIVEMLKHGINADERIAELFLEIGLKHSALGTYGTTLLHATTALNYERATKRLLDHGQDANVKTHGEYPINFAARSGNFRMVRLLIERGADLNVRDERWGQSPLSSAAEFGYDAITRLLLANGADTESRDDQDGSTPLFWAAKKGNAVAARLLLEKGTEANARNQAGLTPILTAAENGNGAVVRVLLEYGADVGASDKKGRTALHYAASGGFRRLASILMELPDVKPELADGEGQTAVKLAISGGHEKLADFLRRHPRSRSREDVQQDAA